MIIVTDIDNMSHGLNLCLGIAQLSCIDLGELLSHTFYHSVTQIYTFTHVLELSKIGSKYAV